MTQIAIRPIVKSLYQPYYEGNEISQTTLNKSLPQRQQVDDLKPQNVSLEFISNQL